jgi:hypothetical protein
MTMEVKPMTLTSYYQMTNRAIGQIMRDIELLDNLIARHCHDSDFLTDGSISDDLAKIKGDLHDIIDCLLL